MKPYLTLLEEISQSILQNQLKESLFELIEDSELEDLYYFQEEFIEESLGNLQGVPPGLLKTITGKGSYGSTIRGGAYSKREETSSAKTKSQLKSMIANAVGEHKMAIIHKNGKPIAAVAHNDGSIEWNERPNYSVHTPNSSDVNFIVKNQRSGTYQYVKRESVSGFPKGEAIDRAMNKINRNINLDEPEKEHFKKNSYNVVTIGVDKRRKAAHDARLERKRAGTDSITSNEIIASKKLANKKLGSTGNPYYVASLLYKKLGDAIEHSDKEGAIIATKNLEKHLSDYYGGLSKEDKDVEKYAKLLRDLKSDYKRDYDSDLYKKITRADLKILRDIRK